MRIAAASLPLPGSAGGSEWEGGQSGKWRSTCEAAGTTAAHGSELPYHAATRISGLNVRKSGMLLGSVAHTCEAVGGQQFHAG